MFSEVVKGSHYFVPKSEITNLDLVMDRLTVVSKYENGPEVPVYLDLPESLGIPLHFVDIESRSKRIKDIRAQGSKIRYNFTSTLRPAQDHLITRFEQYLTSGNTGFILEAPPGFGKTVCLIKMAQILGRKAIVVVPRSNLVAQWVERFRDHTDLPKSRIGWVSGKDVKVRGVSVVIGLVHSLSRYADSRKFPFQFGTAIFDEVDRSVPPATFAPVVGMFPAMYRIGASATLKRADGMHKIFQWHMGERYLRGSDEGRMKPKVLVHDFAENSGYVHAQSDELNRRGMLLSRLAENPARNLLIARYVKMIYNSGRRCVVISDRSMQLKILRSLVASRFDIPKKETGLYVRSIPMDDKGKKRKTMKKADLERVASACKVIFATYGMMGIGTDIPDLAGLIYATPQSDVKQSKGRIERMCKDKLQPVIVDIVDSAYADAKRWGQNRLRHYLSSGLEIKHRH